VILLCCYSIMENPKSSSKNKKPALVSTLQKRIADFPGALTAPATVVPGPEHPAAVASTVAAAPGSDDEDGGFGSMSLTYEDD